MKQLFNDENAEALGASFVANTTEEEVELIEESNTAIGMLSNAWIDDDIKGLSIITDNGLITPIKENIDNGTYPIIRPLYLVYSVNADANTLAFIEFVKSEKGKTIIQKEGYSSASNVY
jgi:phosphate transport system substrate-binding protein